MRQTTFDDGTGPGPADSNSRDASSRVILVGAGEAAEELVEFARAAGFEVAALIEGLDRERTGQAGGPPVIWVDEQAGFEPDLPIAPAIGSVQRRTLMERLMIEGRRLATIVHPQAFVAASAIIEDGCVICPAALVNPHARLGRGTVVTSGVIVGHHVDIGAHSFLGSGANIGGHVVTGPQVTIALGATVRSHITIGAGATVGAGAVAVKDVAPGTVVLGVPARPTTPRPGPWQPSNQD